MLRVMRSGAGSPTHAAPPRSAPSSPASSPDSTASLGPAGTTTDASGAAQHPDTSGPRLPLGPASGAELLTHQRPFGARDDDAPLGASRFRANPAQVYTPGAAPIPQGDEYDAHAAATRGQAASFVASSPAAMKASAAFSNALTPEAEAEMANIRTQIVGHKRRADSLRHVVDSLTPLTTPSKP